MFLARIAGGLHACGGLKLKRSSQTSKRFKRVAIGLLFAVAVSSICVLARRTRSSVAGRFASVEVVRKSKQELSVASKWSRKNLTVAVVLCSTTRGVKDTRWDRLALSSIMLPSLRDTMEAGYTYSLYVGVDSDDAFYVREENLSQLRRIAGTDLNVIVEAYPRTERRIPMNQILERAFEDDNDYIVRINDDTQFLTKRWTSIGIDELMARDPANVGVVGPVVYGPKNVNRKILTHDMVHRTHMEIFKCSYYPEVFENVWIDDWITFVYGHRARALSDWRVHHHTSHHGTRYGVDKTLKASLRTEVELGRIQIKRWIHGMRERNAEDVASCDAMRENRAGSCDIDRFRFPTRNVLREVRDVLEESDVRIVAEKRHSDHEMRYRIDSNVCASLNPNVWIECAGVGHDFSGKRSRFCTSNSYVVEFSCAFVEMWGSTHESVPGAIFDVNRAFLHQHYVRAPDTSTMPSSITHYERLGTALYPYLDAPGHFPHETLPKVLWLLQTLPRDVPVLAPMTTWTKRYYDALAKNGFNTSRIIPFVPTFRSVVIADKIYTPIEWPFCAQDGNPNHGGEPSEYPYEIMNATRDAMVPHALKATPAKSIVLIDRGKHARRFVRHKTLVRTLKSVYDGRGYVVEEFGPDFLTAPLSEHIALFNRAAIVIGPHGAGFSNLIFCRENTAVVEIGFDSSRGMQLDEMYFQLALGLHLRYWLVMGRGSYVGTIDASVEEIMRVVRKALSMGNP